MLNLNHWFSNNLVGISENRNKLTPWKKLTRLDRRRAHIVQPRVVRKQHGLTALPLSPTINTKNCVWKKQKLTANPSSPARKSIQPANLQTCAVLGADPSSRHRKICDQGRRWTWPEIRGGIAPATYLAQTLPWYCFGGLFFRRRRRCHRSPPPLFGFLKWANGRQAGRLK